MHNFWPALLITSLLCIHGIKKSNLTLSSLFVVMLTGIVVFTFRPLFGVLLTAFYLSSSSLTHYGSGFKERQQDVRTQRSGIQVLTNSVWVSLGTVLEVVGYSGLGKRLESFVFGVVCCCCGDTWGSEVGSAVGGRTVLVTTFRECRPGTNGGVSMVGTVASAAGGAFIGAVAAAATFVFKNQFVGYSTIQLVLHGAFLGLLGSLIDSIMGATLQPTYYNPKTNKITHNSKDQLVNGLPLLTNELVNLSSSLFTGLLYCYYFQI